ncbi:unnamed protein product [Lymnaea stagnalis]|uniref:TNFR-Cys domain-containing protein n=1 Tax=Lymnaea stagnalis TaxID=6523 RepID=A0AAV2HVH0_LYMST
MPLLKMLLILIIYLANNHVTSAAIDGPCHHCVHRTQEPHVTRLCPAGHYWDNTTNNCRQCEHDTYLKDDYTCDHCDVPDEYFHEKTIKPCNITSNTLIGCEEGYFRTLDPGLSCDCQWICRPCDICGVSSNMFLNYETRPCTLFSNTVCCGSRDLVVDGDGNCASPDGSFPYPARLPDVSPGGRASTVGTVGGVTDGGPARNGASITMSSFIFIAQPQIALRRIISART